MPLIHHCLHHLVNREVGGINLQRSWCRFQGCDRSGAIPGIPRLQIGGKVNKISRKTLINQLLIASFRACPGAGGQKTFNRALGKTTVPMSRPSATNPGIRAKSRWRSIKARRTAGNTAILEASTPTSSARMA